MVNVYCLSCVYTSAEKSTELKLIMLVRVPLYSQTETRWNHIDAVAHFLKLKFWPKIVKV